MSLESPTSSFAAAIARSTSAANTFKCSASFANNSCFCGTVVRSQTSRHSVASLQGLPDVFGSPSLPRPPGMFKRLRNASKIGPAVFDPVARSQPPQIATQVGPIICCCAPASPWEAIQFLQTSRQPGKPRPCQAEAAQLVPAGGRERGRAGGRNRLTNSSGLHGRDDLVRAFVKTLAKAGRSSPRL